MTFLITAVSYQFIVLMKPDSTSSIIMTVDKPDGPRRSQSFKETSKKTRSKIHQGADPISDTNITDETYSGSCIPRLRAQSIHKPVASARNQSKSSKRRSSLPSCSFKNYLSVPTTCPTMSEGSSDGSDESLRRVSSLKENLRADGKREREPLRRVRSFKTTSKGLINHGDSFKRKQANCTPVLLFDCDGTNSTGECVESGIIPTVSIERETTRAQTEPANYFFRVLMLGAPGVGKSSLTNQFMTSEYLGTSDFGISRSMEEKTVSLLVDGDESTLEFIDGLIYEMPYMDYAVTNRSNNSSNNSGHQYIGFGWFLYYVDELKSLSGDAYVVVFSITDRLSFENATDILRELHHECGTERAIILVANKSDLVRNRKVPSEEAREIADQFECKYTETSAVLNHNVDELLVGILKQILLRISKDETEELGKKTTKPRSRPGSFKKTKQFLDKLLGRNQKQEKSCENLYVS